MAWRRPGDKPLSGPRMVRLPTHICVTRPQWVKPLATLLFALHNNGGTIVTLPYWPFVKKKHIIEWWISIKNWTLEYREFIALPFLFVVASQYKLHRSLTVQDWRMAVSLKTFTTVPRPMNLKPFLWWSSYMIDNVSMVYHKWPLLLTWFNFNPSMDKKLHPL